MNGGEDCPGDPVEEEECNEGDCPCVFNMQSYYDQFAENPPAGPVGYIDTDGVEGKSQGDTPVYIDDEIEDDVVVYVNCNNW